MSATTPIGAARLFEMFLPGYYHWLWVVLVGLFGMMAFISTLAPDYAPRWVRALLSVSVVAVSAGLIFWILDRTPQDEAISALRQMGARTEVDPDHPDKPIVKVKFDRYKRVSAEKMSAFIGYLKELPDLREVDFNTGSPGIDELTELNKQFPKVKFWSSDHLYKRLPLPSSPSSEDTRKPQ